MIVDLLAELRDYDICIHGQAFSIPACHLQVLFSQGAD